MFTEEDNPRRFTWWQLEVFVFVGLLPVFADAAESAVAQWVVPALLHKWDLGAPDFANLASANKCAYALGSLAAGIAGDKFGRRPAFIAFLLLTVVASCGSALSPNWPTFFVLRFLANAGAGFTNLTYPLLEELLLPQNSKQAIIDHAGGYGICGGPCPQRSGGGGARPARPSRRSRQFNSSCPNTCVRGASMEGIYRAREHPNGGASPVGALAATGNHRLATQQHSSGRQRPTSRWQAAARRRGEPE
jgi:hypothetical protein